MIRHQLALFFVLAFVLGWGVPLAALVIAGGFGLDLRGFWPFQPFGALVWWSPAIAACLVIGFTRGPAALVAFVRRLGQWWSGPGWYLFALVGIPVACLIASRIAAASNPSANQPTGESWGGFVIDALRRAAAGPISELGWRGYAQPMLQRRFGAIEASVLIGGIWALWMLPVFIFGPSFAGPAGPLFDLQLTTFVVRAVALSLILGVVYNRTHGSVPVCMLVHWTASLPYPGQGTPAAVPAEALVFTLVAILLLTLSRTTMTTGSLERHVTRLQGVET